MKDIKALIFDKDGTLFDFATTWESWARSFLLRLSEGDMAHATRAGHSIGFDMVRGSFDPESLAIAGTPAELVDVLHPMYPALSQAALADVLNEEAEQAPQQMAVPLVPLLSGFRAAGMKLGVATNDAEKPARAHLAQAGVTALFDFIAGYDSGFGGKPAPGQLLGFADHVGYAPRHIAMVGDSTHDLHAGRAAGMTCIGVLTGMAEADDLAPHADVVLPDIGHLPAWLEQATRQNSFRQT